MNCKQQKNKIENIRQKLKTFDDLDLIGNRLIFEQNGVKNAVANKRIRMATTPKNKMR